jgi:hypothetical protein
VYICSGAACTGPKLQTYNSTTAAAAPIIPSQGYFQTAALLTATAPPTANTAFPYTAGSINFGGGAPTAIAAGSLTLSGGALNNCGAPAYSSCGFGYFNGSAIAWTTSLGTATAAGDFPIWAVTLDSTSTALTVVPFSLMPPASVPLGAQVLAVVEYCGTTTTCAKTVETVPYAVYGDVTLSSHTATLTALPFTSTASYACTASDLTGVGSGSITYASASSAVVTDTGGGATDHYRYICVGY